MMPMFVAMAKPWASATTNLDEYGIRSLPGRPERFGHIECEYSTTLDGQTVLRPLNAKRNCASADCFTKTQEARISGLGRVTFAVRNARTKILEAGNHFRVGRYAPAASTCVKTVLRVRYSRLIWRFNGLSRLLFCRR